MSLLVLVEILRASVVLVGVMTHARTLRLFLRDRTIQQPLRGAIRAIGVMSFAVWLVTLLGLVVRAPVTLASAGQFVTLAALVYSVRYVGRVERLGNS